MTFIETGPVLDTAVLYHVLQQSGCLIHEEFGAVSREREWLIMFMEFLPRICGLISVLGNVRRNKKRLDCGSSAAVVSLLSPLEVKTSVLLVYNSIFLFRVALDT